MQINQEGRRDEDANAVLRCLSTADTASLQTDIDGGARAAVEADLTARCVVDHGALTRTAALHGTAKELI